MKILLAVLALILFSQLSLAQFPRRPFGPGPGPFAGRPGPFGGPGFRGGPIGGRGGPIGGRGGPFTNVNPGQSASFANAGSQSRSLTLITPFGPIGLVGSRSNANSGAVAASGK